MLSKLKDGPKVVGFKQSSKAITQGTAACVFLAQDADPRMTESIRRLCLQHSVPLAPVETMRSLGIACGIAVGASVAVLLSVS